MSDHIIKSQKPKVSVGTCFSCYNDLNFILTMTISNVKKALPFFQTICYIEILDIS